MKKYRGGADVRSDIDDPARPKMLYRKEGIVISLKDLEQMPLFVASIVKRERVALPVTVNR
jgi:hypothetical protein